MNTAPALIVCFISSLLTGIGVGCIAAIYNSLDVSILAGIGAFCIALAVTVVVWAVNASGGW